MSATVRPWRARTYPFADVLVMAKRSMLAHVRTPAQLATTAALPVMWVLLFNYVLGGGFQRPGAIPYIEYLVPGVLVLAVTFNMNNVAVAVAEDLQKGMIERFRSLPMGRSSFLAGRTVFDIAKNLLAIAVVFAIGALAGFRFQTGAAAVLEAVGVTLALGFAISWLGVLIGLLAGNVEAAQAGSLLLVIPAIFITSLFVPIGTMPQGVQAVARNNPVTHAVDAARALLLGEPAATAVIQTLLWSAGIVIVVIPLAVLRYNRTTR